MSDNYETASPSGSDVRSSDTSEKVDAAKQEATDLKNTAQEQAQDVLGTAKDEAASVVGEAKTQAKDLYAQTKSELTEQANTQQQRIAGGLRSVSDELGEMATTSTGSGVASDLVQQVSGRLSSAASWLGDRDPASVVNEVKRYARRRPGAFILAAAIGGIVVGRLTRALAANASDEKDAAPTSSADPAPRLVHVDPAVPVPVSAPVSSSSETPVYTQAASVRPDLRREDGNDRPDTI